MSEHVLVTQAKVMTGAPDQHRQVAEVASAMDRAVASALSITDPDEARTVLPTVLRELYRQVLPLIGSGLINGSVWLTQQHARLFGHAQTLFGAGAEHVVQRPPHEPMPAGGRSNVFRLPRP